MARARGKRNSGGAVRGRLQLKGFKEFEKRLQELPKRLAKKLLRRALRSGAKVIQAEVKARTPVVSGAGRRSIKVRAAKGKKKGQVAVAVQTSAGDFKGEQFYMSFLEYGYDKVPVVRGPGGQLYSMERGTEPTIPMPPVGMFRGGFDSKKGEAERVIAKELAAGIVREAKA